MMQRKIFLIINIVFFSGILLLCCGFPGLASSTDQETLEHVMESENTLPTPKTTPDSWWYSMTRIMENIDLFFTFDEEVKAEKLAYYAELRLAELQEMVEENKTEYINELVQDYSGKIEETSQLLKRVNQSSKDVSEFIYHMVLSTFSHEDILEDLKQNLPLQAQSVIDQAMNQSRKCNADSFEMLSSVQPQRAAEINIQRIQKIITQTLGAADANDTMVDEVKTLVNDSINLITIAKSKQINTTEIETLLSNITIQLFANMTNNQSELVVELIDQFPSEILLFINDSLNMSTNDHEAILQMLHSFTSESEFNMTDIEAICDIVFDELTIQELSNLGHEIKNISSLSWINSVKK